MSIGTSGIRKGLDDVETERQRLAETDNRTEIGRAYVSVDGTLYLVDHIEHMVQRDEVTVVCPIIVAGRPLR